MMARAMPPTPSTELPQSEQRLGPYRLVRPISAGGMARVYEGRLDSLAGVSTRVAVKVIHPEHASEAGFQELFINEARISARLEHQNLVRIQAFNREGALYYLVMEFIDGITFRKVISTCRRHGLQLPLPLIAELGRQACEGLHYAHTLTTEHGEPLHLVHRDIKPSNLMFTGHGVVKVLDFGISSARGADDAGGSVKGTWGYMALEQADGGDVGPAADLFGLGAVLYELATLEPLFEEKENALIRERLRRDDGARRAAALAGPHADLAGVLVRALQRDPAARFRSAASMGAELGRLVRDPHAAGDGLMRLFEELRQLEKSGAPPAQADRRRSNSSAGRPASAPGLPITAGTLHHPAISPASEGPPQASRRRSSWWMGPAVAAVLVALSLPVIGFTAWTLLKSGRAPRPEPVLAHPEPPPQPEAPPSAPPPQVEPARPPESTPAPKPPPKSKPEPPPVEVKPAPTPVATIPTPAPPAVEEPAPTGDGMLTISSIPRAQVMIDGQYVRFTPLYQHAVSAGSHTVLLVAEDGRRKTFRVDVVPGAELRRIWLFEEGKWSE
jgi:serine/threonine-protein kinase